MVLTRVAAGVEELQQSAKEDLDFLASLIAPETFTLNFNEIYHTLFNLIKQKLDLDDFIKFGIGLPRGHAKTTFFKIITLYIILFTDRNYILVVCANEAKAINFISDVFQSLESPNIRAVFGSWNTSVFTDTKSLKHFRFRGRQIIISAIGAGGDPRGTSLNFKRPDVIICDDVQSRESAASESQNKQLIEWFLATLLKSAAPERCLCIYIGNMYPFKDTLLKRIKASPDWTTIIIGALLADGTALWPELRSKESLIKEFEEDSRMGHPEIFISEVLNNSTATSINGFDASELLTITDLSIVEDAKLFNASYVIGDPSGSTSTSDPAQLGLFQLIDGIPTLTRLEVENSSPKAFVIAAFDMARAAGTKNVFFEDVAFQRSLLYWASTISTEFNVRGVSPASKSKASRIKRLFDACKQKEFAVTSETCSQFVHQAMYYNPAAKNNKDDILDICAYAIDIPVKFDLSLPQVGFTRLPSELPSRYTRF